MEFLTELVNSKLFWPLLAISVYLGVMLWYHDVYKKKPKH